MDACGHYLEEEGGSGCDCSVVVPSLVDPDSVPFKVRAWLYRRASRRAFGRSEDDLGGCMDLDRDLDNPYNEDLRPAQGMFWDEEDLRKVKEWEVVWVQFRRHLLMQRVQRVNTGDPRVKPEWTRRQKIGGKGKREAKEETGRRGSLEDREELDDKLIETLREAEEAGVYVAVPDTPPRWIRILRGERPGKGCRERR
ncbi:hypothetical protein GJ744_005854 [Endocarpon pusillum]|uniref:Uncharacterized protein n=1 Tax=Endocarpon pusillum TaxID=364733 RepID=A0A8H7A850_9EURO|nr:hypothetical protein GJ744_005854 [Endocarpon pusillum]